MENAVDTNTVWQLLGQIPIGTVIAWILVIAAIIGAISGLVIKLYKVFDKYRKVKDEKEQMEKDMVEIKDTLIKLDSRMDNFEKSLEEQKESLDEQRRLNFKNLRKNIIQICDEAIVAGEISESKFRSLEEMFQEYEDVYNGNSYVKPLMVTVRTLPKVRKIND